MIVQKVLIDAKTLGLTGIEFERMLRDHCIEVELVQAHHVLSTHYYWRYKGLERPSFKAVQATI